MVFLIKDVYREYMSNRFTVNDIAGLYPNVIQGKNTTSHFFCSMMKC